MKTISRPAPAQQMLAAPLQQPRQLSIAFETPVLMGLAAEQRTAAVHVLAEMLLQAAGAHLREDDDAEQ